MQPELARWFEAARIPRYTSYPTAPHFTPAVGAAQHARWLTALPEGETVSLYLHVPFCRQLCWYCGCHTSITQDQSRIDAYAGFLEREIEIVRHFLPGDRGARVSHLHWGGGTPTALGTRWFTRLMRTLRTSFEVLPDAEIAIELDPRTADHETLDALAAVGVNRVSLGVQTFDTGVQEAINRHQPLAMTAKVVDGLTMRGIDRINIDMLYGLPRQTVANSAETAWLVAGLGPSRIAVFGYAHVPDFKRHQRMIDEAALPDAAARVEQFEAIAATLEGAGYVPVGLDHFAKPDDAMAVAAGDGTLRRNFQGYTTDAAATLIGLGCSSISSFAQGYVQNDPGTKSWREAIMAGRLPTARGIVLTADDRLRRDVIEALMCRGEADLAAIAARHGRPVSSCAPDADRLAQAVELGIARVEGDVVRVDPDYRPLLRVVAAAFDAYLRPEGGRHAAAV